MNQNVVRVAVRDQITVIFGQRLKAWVGRLNVDIRGITGPSEHSLNTECLMTDGVTITERRHDLVDAKLTG